MSFSIRYYKKVAIILIVILLSILSISIFFSHDNSVSAVGPSWWDISYQYRKVITIDTTKISGTLSNFPVLVKLDSTNFTFSKSQSQGQDLRFIDHTSTPVVLSHEIESFNSVTQEANIWVKFPTLSTTQNVIYLYYGNAGATDGQNKTGVWDSNYKGVWHLSQGDSTASGFYTDSTSNANNGTLTDADGDTTTVTGQVNGSLDFNGDADFVKTTWEGALTQNTLEI